MNLFKKLFPGIVSAMVALTPGVASANIVDALDLSPFVPIVLDAMMTIATGGYEFFVGNGDGIIYVLVWGFLAVTLAMYVLKLYIPKGWGEIFGFSGGGELASGNVTGWTIAENMLKPAVRAIIAAAVLLQLKPVFVTQWLVNPFLQFGAIYTHAITDTVNEAGIQAPRIECPADIVEKAWISQESCEYLVQPVSDLSHANNQIIKKGFDYLNTGLRSTLGLMPHGGEGLLNIITGIILIFTFVGSNLFMALLVIQAIFNFGMALILYPFQVLSYVAKSNSKWFDVWPAFAGITKAVQELIVTMIACAFILCINLAIIKALFRWNSSVFVVAAGGTATTNVPQIANTASVFGEHSIMWLSAVLTFYLMFKIFDMTQAQLKKYVGGMDGLYNQAKGDAKTLWGGAKKLTNDIGTAIGWIKKK